MEYLALYRKYRPKELNEVVGQNEIKKILASSVKNGTVTHAYLFSGPRGTGKTTMAKILAKMVNCEHPVDGNACNKCASCLNILQSNDVIEIDAASNNGVDEIRNLREKANLVPTSSKYKVYIIDEVHMLTTQAFNALLKTLEEPPKHVIFILATTEYYKIPLTITSRCQKFQFNKIKTDDIVEKLKEIAKLEKIKIEDAALFEIAKISDGGMRDSINFLDQLRSFNNEKITINDVYEVCGNISLNDMVDLLIKIKDNDVEYITEFFEKMNSSGKNYNKFFEDFICLLKDIVLYIENVNKKYIKYDINCIEKISKKYSLKEIFNIIDKINLLIDKLKNVSRQGVVVITNFLLIMNELNNSDNLSLNQSLAKSKEIKENYEMAFDFTNDSKENDSQLTATNLQISDSSDNNLVYNSNIDKESIINNAFAVANKELKQTLQGKNLLLENYLTDKKYSNVAGSLLDATLQVAGNGYIIFSCSYEAIIDKINKNYKLCNELLNLLYGDEYCFVVIDDNEWEKCRNEYISNVKSGKKYELKKVNKESTNNVKTSKKKETVVDKLFDLVGEDIVEFK